jgi:2-oxoglutarate dehydrogenase E2 component (dihydrolipoamide succinyltransferase)
MSTEIKVPVLPESVSDATIATWHKKVGDAVKRDENIVDLETDKVVLEVPSPVDGVIKEIKFPEGTTVNSQQLIAVVEEGAAAAAPAPESKAAMDAKNVAATTAEPSRCSPSPRRPSLPPLRPPPLNCRRVRASPPSPRASIRRRSKAPAVAAR